MPVLSWEEASDVWMAHVTRLSRPEVATNFVYFRWLPVEIQRMIWKLALPSRIILLEDGLTASTHRDDESDHKSRVQGPWGCGKIIGSRDTLKPPPMGQTCWLGRQVWLENLPVEVQIGTWHQTTGNLPPLLCVAHHRDDVILQQEIRQFDPNVDYHAQTNFANVWDNLEMDFHDATFYDRVMKCFGDAYQISSDIMSLWEVGKQYPIITDIITIHLPFSSARASGLYQALEADYPLPADPRPLVYGRLDNHAFIDKALELRGVSDPTHRHIERQDMKLRAARRIYQLRKQYREQNRRMGIHVFRNGEINFFALILVAICEEGCCTKLVKHQSLEEKYDPEVPRVPWYWDDNIDQKPRPEKKRKRPAGDDGAVTAEARKRAKLIREWQRPVPRLAPRPAGFFKKSVERNGISDSE